MNNRATKSFLSLCISISFSLVSAQTASEIQWQNTIGGFGDDKLYSVIQTSDGGYLLGGNSHSGISGDKTEMDLNSFDYWVLKLDEFGNIEWQNTIGGNDHEELNSVIQTADGGYLLGGNSESKISGDKIEASQGGQDYWVVKLDESGNLQWQNTIGGSNNEELSSVIQTTDGGFLLGGSSPSGISGDKTEISQGNNDNWVVKLDSLGNIQWQNTIGGDGSDRLHSVIQTTDGGYFLGGYSDSGISGDKSEPGIGGDYWVLKLDESGDITWQNDIGGNASDVLFSVIQTTDGGYLLGGESFSDISGDKTEVSQGSFDYWVLKLDNSGNIEWQNAIGGNDVDALYSIIQTKDGGYLLGGSSYSGYSGDKTEVSVGEDYWVVRLNASGSVQWQNTIVGNWNDRLTSVAQTTDGGYLLGGYSNSSSFGDKTEVGKGGYDYWIVKLSVEGQCDPPITLSTIKVTNSIATLRWNTVSEAIGYKVRYKIADSDKWFPSRSADNNKILSGLTAGTKYAWQVKSICSTQPIVSSAWSEKQFFTTDALRLEAIDQSMVEIYPNPVSQSATISFYISEESPVVLEIINLNGKSLRVIADENFSEGIHEVTFDCESLVGGIYFLQLKTNDGVTVRKMIVE